MNVAYDRVTFAQLAHLALSLAAGSHFDFYTEEDGSNAYIVQRLRIADSDLILMVHYGGMGTEPYAFGLTEGYEQSDENQLRMCLSAYFGNPEYVYMVHRG